MSEIESPRSDAKRSSKELTAPEPQLRSVSSLEQAAILMLSMGDEVSASVLRYLSREEIVNISQAMARVSNIKRPVVSDVISRFFDEYKEQSSIKGASRAYLSNMLNKALGSDITRTLLDGIYGEEIRAKMAKLEWLDPAQFATLLAEEHVQMQAVFLAFLPPAMATSVLECMPQERQDDLLYRIANLSDVSSDVIQELEQLIDRSLEVLSMQGSTVHGIKQAADIINRFSGNRDQMFEILRARDPQLVSSIEDQMYDFFILSRQPEEVLQVLLEVIPLDEWAVALKGAEPEVVKAVHAALPRRQMQQLNNINRRQGAIPISRIEQVRKEIMAMVREMAANDEIQLQLFREQTVD
ncbi:flagellar motor switch protein FliG [Alkalilimnicola ehrlichii]|uniref:Flagellar motor switch protein FliG n=1 Tax=Alkalilimnicola ehrlichii TaxID=351052 RepID=A0A3E0WZ34_9GAMM|nr:FliG C-terminal domain-containing protein [Alkalilimnicola ehrlichii]RFA30720.1 flagellar motor switch protein FliG [Alkalilimnicola ehrlichii]RFA38296.1 flagellar motor switch protein FliG [Alkalilimnicola ehrlichii]